MERIRKENPNTRDYWESEAIKKGFLTNYDFPPRDVAWEIMRHIDFGNSVLDVGAGSGMITRRLKEIRPNLHISACDFSLTAVEWIKEKIPLNEVFWCDITKGIDKPDKSYDVVVCTEVLEHLENTERAIKELARLATKKVIITTPYKDDGTGSTEHIWSFGLDDIFSLFKDYGMVYLTVAGGNSNIVAVCNLR